MTKKQECLKALQCLYLQVDATIADDVKRRVLEALDEANKNFVLADVKHQLIAYQKWCYEHPEYDQLTETPKVELYLKAINCA